MNRNELISIIVPVYNKEKYIKKCIESIIGQTYSNIEIILVNDGSTDSSLKILNEYQKQDSRINVIDKKNGGVSSARNAGIKKASGEKLLFVDADDYIADDYVENLIKYDYDYVMCSYQTLQNETIIAENRYEEDIESGNVCNEVLKPQYKRMIAMPYLKTFKKSILLDNNISFDETMRYGEDTCFVMQYLNYCSNAKIINYNGYYNRVEDNNSLSRNYVKNIFEQLDKVNFQICNLKDLSINVRNYWILRNFKTIVYNERNSTYKEFKNCLNMIRKNKYFSFLNGDNSSYSLIDKIIFFLIKQKFDLVLYYIYKLK